MRRLVVLLGTVAVVGATGWLLLPFDAGPLVRCGPAVVEAWPEPGDGGWVAYVPDTELSYAPGMSSHLCGDEARRRIIPPLVVGWLVLVVAAGRAVLVAFRHGDADGGGRRPVAPPGGGG